MNNQSDTNVFPNIFFIMSGTFVRFHTNKGNRFVNKYAKVREYSLHSYFLRNFCFTKLIKNMAVTRNIYTDGTLFDNEYLYQNAHFCFEKNLIITKTKHTFNLISKIF